jgi:hypothetical protein
MTEKNLTDYKRKYQRFRHHAWAGLGFLSVVIAIRIIFSEQALFLTPIIVILAIYIVVALIFTYRYQAGLSAEDTIVKVEPSAEVEKERLNAEVEKERLKVEKKKVKAEAKAQKKAGKK